MSRRSFKKEVFYRLDWQSASDSFVEVLFLACSGSRAISVQLLALDVSLAQKSTAELAPEWFRHVVSPGIALDGLAAVGPGD